MRFWRKRNREGVPQEPNDPINGTVEKKSGFMRRLWRWIKGINWKDPVTRWKLVFLLFGSFVLFGVFTFSAIQYTSTPSFCSSCHEMAPEYVTYKATSHNQIKCTQCHIPPGVKNLVIHKVMALNEVYRHVTKTQPNPIAMKHPIENEVCIQCHSKNRLVTASGDLTPAHDKHVEKDIPCIVCHQGVAHGKVVERGLNTNDQYDHWTEDNAAKLITKANTIPNMGTCIDCHDKVNQGQEPWKDEKYVAAFIRHEEGAVEELSADEEKEKTTNLILESIGKQKRDVKLSMECKTCHLDIDTPFNHSSNDWDQNHGGDAQKSLNECANCHQDTKWIKKSPREDILKLLQTDLKKSDKSKAVTIAQVQSHARASSFCGTCHKERPPGHLESDEWLTQHAPLAKTKEEKKLCYVCHDYEKKEITDAPTDVYCKYCHRTGLKDEEQQKAIQKK